MDERHYFLMNNTIWKQKEAAGADVALHIRGAAAPRTRQPAEKRPLGQRQGRLEIKKEQPPLSSNVTKELSLCHLRHQLRQQSGCSLGRCATITWYDREAKAAVRKHVTREGAAFSRAILARARMNKGRS